MPKSNQMYDMRRYNTGNTKKMANVYYLVIMNWFVIKFLSVQFSSQNADSIVSILLEMCHSSFTDSNNKSVQQNTGLCVIKTMKFISNQKLNIEQISDALYLGVMNRILKINFDSMRD